MHTRDRHGAQDRKEDRTSGPTGRREVLQASAAGGMLLATGLFGALLTPTTGEAGQPAGALTPPAGKLRRIVSALNADGKSYIAIDESVDVANLWTTVPGQPMGQASTSEPAGPRTATGQTRCFVAAIQPSKDPKPSMTNRLGYHKGAGISYCLILDGTLTYMVDTQETVVRAGDLVVERSTLHSWRNEGSKPVSMFIVTVNAA